MTGSAEPPTGGPQDDLRILTEAASWQVVLRESGQRTSAALEAWLSHPAHAEAWAKVRSQDRWLDGHAAAPEAIAVRSEVLQRAARRQVRPGASGPMVSRRFAAVSLGAVLLGGLGAGALWWRMQHETYETDIGERRTVVLRDGSRVTMDSGTEVRVEMGRSARRLELVRGQALFDVAHDNARPFSVSAGDRVVVAYGTSFNVDMIGPAVAVTLLEGRVDVFKRRRSALSAGLEPGLRLAKLRPGQQFGSTDGAPARQTVVDPDVVIAWKAGQLVFDDASLADVAERMNRYSPLQLSVTPEAAPLRVSGVFDVGDIATFVAVVQRALPVRADTDGTGGTRLSLRQD